MPIFLGASPSATHGMLLLANEVKGEFMTSIKPSAKRLASRGFSALPVRFLQQIERASGVALGKGWGSGTVVEEVRAAISLLPPLAGRLSVLDVGANVGAWTAAILEAVPDAIVYSFEPSAAAFSQLSTRFSGDDRVYLINTAVGDEVGTARLWADAPGSGLGSLHKRRLDHLAIDFSYSEQVPVLTLDTWHSGSVVHPIILKMDVEGKELAVLHGARDTLKSVKVVQFEFGGCNIDSRTYFQDFFYFFQEAGFRLHRLGPKGLDRVERYSELDEVFTTTNYFAQRI